VWQQTGVKPKELENLVELKQEYYEIWSWFTELNESRTSNGFGMNPISYSDIAAYFNLQQITPHKWEVDTLRRLDREVLNIYAKKVQADSKKSSKS
jgi:YbbR domain-containing protein